MRHRHEDGVTLVKKYGNRRLYDTRRSRYVTLEELAETIAAGEALRVVDAHSGEDLTKAVLLRVILTEEKRKRLTLLPLSFLEKLIQYRDASLREFYQRYLELALEVFREGQRRMAKDIEGLAPSAAPSSGSSPAGRELQALKARLAALEARVSGHRRRPRS